MEAWALEAFFFLSFFWVKEAPDTTNMHVASFAPGPAGQLAGDNVDLVAHPFLTRLIHRPVVSLCSGFSI
jgi:hypothetical protein